MNYTVQASIVNIEKDSPSSEDAFLVDTNVWLWMCYNRASLSLDVNLKQLTTYPAYLKKTISAKAKLHRSNLSFAELSHLIEKYEHQYYVRMKGSDISPKEFRHHCPPERANVVGEIETAWHQVKELASPTALSLDETTTDSALARCKTQLVDGYDLYILESLQTAGLLQIISHDGDFCTVPGITLFTANPSVIAAATRQGKLVSR